MSDLASLDGKYQILAKLREGGMGAIYKVRHRLLDEIRVIKVMRPQLADDDAFVERFQREAKAASRLRHPNIAQIYDFSIGSDGSAYIVMEYIDGVDLRELIGKERLPAVSLVLDIATQALTALDFLHEKQFVHRDISPDNLMVTTGPTGEFLVKLIDLGIAKSLDSGQAVTLKGEFLGKFRYASPEHFGGATGEEEVEPRSDVYSFGIVLYQLLTGQVPFLGKDFSAITASHLYRPPVPFDQTDSGGRLSAQLRAIVLKALEKDPEKRYVSALAMRDALAALPERQEDFGLDLEETLLLARTKRRQEEASQAGSTQERFDRQFPDAPTAETTQPTARAAEQATRPLGGGFDPREAPTTIQPAAAPPTRSRGLVAGMVAVVVVVALLAWWLGRRGPQRPDLAVEPTVAEAATTPTDPPASTVPEVEPAPAVDADALLSEMRLARDELLALETSNPTASDLAAGWRQFLISFSTDLAETEEDDRIREVARQRQGYWEGRDAAEQEAAQVAQAAPSSQPPRATANRPGAADRPGTNVPRGPRRNGATPEGRRALPNEPITSSQAREFLTARGIEPSTAALKTAVDRGDGRMAVLLVLADPSIVPAGKPGRQMLEEAVERHRFDLATALYDGGARPDDDFITGIASDGDLPALRFLGERRAGDLEEALEDALDSDEWEAARYLVQIGVPLSGAVSEATDMLIDLAEDGDADGIRWLLSVDPGIADRRWNKAIEVANEHGFPSIARMIQDSRR